MFTWKICHVNAMIKVMMKYLSAIAVGPEKQQCSYRTRCNNVISIWMETLEKLEHKVTEIERGQGNCSISKHNTNLSKLSLTNLTDLDTMLMVVLVLFQQFLQTEKEVFPPVDQLCDSDDASIVCQIILCVQMYLVVGYCS